ncbi:MAG: CBS domain-containing protein [Rhodospirillales bacterium]|nr:CBS domain-containing protein [Rhodospirillales bacterium]
MRRKIVPDVVHDQELVHLASSASLREAAKLMRARNVASVLVLEDGRLQGIFTERDMVRRVVAAGRDPDGTTLGEVMTRNPDTIAPSSTALDALRLMHDGGYRHLPVVEGGRVVAVVSRRDFAGLEKAQLDDETSAWERIG